MGRCNTICGNVDLKGGGVWHKQGDRGFLLRSKLSFGSGGRAGNQ
jgi:hypothetical protein